MDRVPFNARYRNEQMAHLWVRLTKVSVALSKIEFVCVCNWLFLDYDS